MDMLEKVEQVRAKCDVNYAEAKAALDAAGGDVLDAIIALEAAGKAKSDSVNRANTAGAGDFDRISPEMKAAQEDYHNASRANRVGASAERLGNRIGDVLRRWTHIDFVVTRKDERIASVPFIVIVVLLLVSLYTGFSILLLAFLFIVALFCGFRFRLDSPDKVSSSINDFMDKASDSAQKVRKEYAQKGSTAKDAATQASKSDDDSFWFDKDHFGYDDSEWEKVDIK